LSAAIKSLAEHPLAADIEQAGQAPGVVGFTLRLQASAINSVITQLAAFGFVLRRVGYRGETQEMAVLNLTFEGVPESATRNLMALLSAMPTVLSVSLT
jgi:hypothetical protein